MAKKNVVEKVSGKVEVVVNPILETFNGFNDDECVAAIQNTEMKKAVLAYRKATTRLEGGKWDMAKAAARMKVDARKEFGSDERLASFLGLSGKGAFNKLRRVGEHATEAQKLGLSVSVAMELLVLENNGDSRSLEEHMANVACECLTVAEAREYAKAHMAEKPAKDSKKDAEKSDAKKVQDAIKKVQDEDGRAAKETEEEDHWIPVLEIAEEDMTELEKEMFEKALIDLCKDFNVKAWIKNLR